MQPIVLVTGAAGFVGRNLLREVTRRGLPYQLVGVDLNVPMELRQDCPNVHFYDINLADCAACHALISAQRPDYLLHLAGVTSKLRSSSAADSVLSSNLSTTCYLLEALRDTHYPASDKQPPHFLLTSTGLIYGVQRSPFSESLVPQPPDGYSLSKYLAERAVACSSRMGIIRSCVYRPAILYGPDQTGDMFVPSLLATLRRNERFSMTDGEQTRDFVHVADMIDALLFAVLHEIEGTFNVGSGKATSMRNVALRVAAKLKKEHLLGLGELPYRKHEVWHYALDPSRLAALGWKAQLDLERGIDSCLEAGS